MKKLPIPIFLITLAALFILSGCASPDPSGPDETSGDVTAPAAETSDAETSDLARELLPYTLICSDDADALTVGYAVGIRKELIDRGYATPFSRDFISRNTDYSSPEVAERYEILVGSTNRPESSIGDTLAPDEYAITQTGHKIVVSGGSVFALSFACTELINHIEVGKNGVRFLESSPVSGKAEIPEYKIVATDQLNSCVSVYDLAGGSVAHADAEKTFKLEVYNVADARLRVYGGKTVLLAAYGNERAKMFDYETGEVLWSTTSTAANPHAVEITPSGVIAVASSTGAQVRFFDVSGGNAVKATYDLEDAHGVLYDPEGDFIWAMGKNILVALKAELSNGKITVSEVAGKRYTIPEGGAHDLQPLYGDKDKLWISASQHLYTFSKSTGKFDTELSASFGANIKSIKGIATFPDGNIAYVVPEGQFKSWTTQSVNLVIMVGGKPQKLNLSSNTVGFYKIHAANSNYN